MKRMLSYGFHAFTKDFTPLDAESSWWKSQVAWASSPCFKLSKLPCFHGLNHVKLSKLAFFRGINHVSLSKPPFFLYLNHVKLSKPPFFPWFSSTKNCWSNPPTPPVNVQQPGHRSLRSRRCTPSQSPQPYGLRWVEYPAWLTIGKWWLNLMVNNGELIFLWFFSMVNI